MFDSLYIAWQYIKYNRVKTAVLVACVTLIAFLPLSLEILLDESERQLMDRAVSTPLIVGAKGSALDLVMNSIYFDDEVPEIITMEAVDQVWDADLAVPIPLYVRFHARAFPIIGTSLDYFDFRGLKMNAGKMMTVLGECVIGATVAERLDIGPGDSVVSSPENLFDLAGVYPLKMKVVGVFGRMHTSDDLGIFTDVKTTWIIQGLGHGHEDVTRTRDTTVILDRTDTNVTANAKLLHYNQITEENLDSFHFHGDTSIYPITAVLAVPHDEKSGTILRGRYFRIRNVLDAVIAFVGLATLLAIILVFSLSLRIRQREITTIFRIGCSRMTVARLLAAEILIIILVSGILCIGGVFVVDAYANDLVRALFIQ
jgi:putative ABC transport system permease protein